MRQAGTIPDQRQAKRFADYLLTKGIVTRIDAEAGGCVVWVRDEQHIADSRRELEEFLRDPNNPQYSGVEKDAEQIRREEIRRHKEYQKNLVDVRNKWRMGAAGHFPVTKVILVVMLATTILTNFGHNQYSRWFFIAPFTPAGSGMIEWQGLQAIQQGQVWRLISPIFVHRGVIHLVFGLYMFYSFGRLIETRRGPWRFVFLVLISAVISCLCEYWIADFLRWGDGGIVQPNPNFLGMSGVIYALFGYAWIRSNVDPSSGLRLHPQTIVILMIWLVICFLGIMPIANIAHVTGLLTGMAIGYAPAVIPKFREWT